MAIKDRSDAWARIQKANLRSTRRALGQSILNRGKMIAPELTGDLKSSGRVEDTAEDTTSVIFGDDSVPYARRRHFENNKNPQTLHYLQRAGDSVAKEFIGRIKK